jgi:probable HAF family extracellular repeat protein
MPGRRWVVLTAVLMGALAGVAAVPAAASTASGYRIVDLGAGDNSNATAINDRGHIVGQRESGPFLWRDGQFIDILPAGEFGNVTDINNRDEVVGTHSVSGVTHGFLWRAGVVTDLGTLPGGEESFASAINDFGDIVGSSSRHAFRWRDGVMTDLGVLPGASDSGAADINVFGVIVGGSGGVAVRWAPNGDIQPLTTTPSSAVAVNDFGDITGTIFDSTSDGFFWHRGRLTVIPAPPAPFFPNLQPNGINNRSQTVGSANADAFVWQRGHLTTLPTLASTSIASDINNHGLIVGTSAAGTGFPAQFRAVLWKR